MINSLLQASLSNTCIAFVIAIIAIAIGAKFKRPDLAHLLWLLVFIKLITPPLLAIPVITTPAITTPGQAETPALTASNYHPAETIALHTLILTQEPQTSPATTTLMSSAIPLMHKAKPWLVSIWLLGSALFLIASLSRIYRFNRLLNAQTHSPSPELQTAATRIAHQLGLKTTPTILGTSARLSPVVWWVGGKVRVVIPTLLLQEMDKKQWESILAHELAHVRRRDYLVRWLEWSVLVCFWWNPVAWWGQRMLRETEEMCCDALVLSRLKPEPRAYANSLLQLVESLAYPAFRPPALASEINSGGHLERRFKMIVSKNLNQNTSRTLKACVLLGAIAILPLGLVSAQEETEEVLHEIHENQDAKLDVVHEHGETIHETQGYKVELHEYEEAIHDYLQTEGADPHELKELIHERDEAVREFKGALHEYLETKEADQNEFQVTIHEYLETKEADQSEYQVTIHEYLQSEEMDQDVLVEILHEREARIHELKAISEAELHEREAKIKAHKETGLHKENKELHKQRVKAMAREMSKELEGGNLDGLHEMISEQLPQIIAREIAIELDSVNIQGLEEILQEQLPKIIAQEITIELGKANLHGLEESLQELPNAIARNITIELDKVMIENRKVHKNQGDALHQTSEPEEKVKVKKKNWTKVKKVEEVPHKEK